jgi:hypothetical protein
MASGSGRLSYLLVLCSLMAFIPFFLSSSHSFLIVLIKKVSK